MSLVPKEQRRTTLGLSRGNWITIVIFVISIIAAGIAQAIAYGTERAENKATSALAKENKGGIKEIRKEMKTNAKQLRKEIKESASETQEVLKDQIQILIQTINNK